MAPVHVGRLRRLPDHLPGAARRRRDDHQAAARLRVPLGDRLRARDGPDPCPIRPGPRRRDRGRHGAAVACSRSSARRGSASASSCSSPRSSSAPSTGRRGCGAASATSGSPSPSRTSTRACPTVRRWTAWRLTTSAASCAATGFHVREATTADGTRFLYGDRHQYTKMATLLTHAGLILFLVAAAATARLGDEQGLVVAEGEALTVQPIGTPGLLLVRNHRLRGARLRHRPRRPTSRPTSRSTRTASEIARKTIRVNDPLSVAGYTFHQNGFGPAPHLVLKSAAGEILWDAPVPMTDAVSGRPYASIGIPGRDMGLKLLLDKEADGTGVLIAIPYRIVGTAADGTADRGPLPGGRPASRRHQGLAGPRPVDRAHRLRRVHAADRQARPRPGPRVDRLRLPDRRHHHHVLPAAPPGLDADRARRPARHRLAIRPLCRRRARVRAPARPARGGPQTG